jgi:hypothetical protein
MIALVSAVPLILLFVLVRFLGRLAAAKLPADRGRRTKRVRD